MVDPANALACRMERTPPLTIGLNHPRSCLGLARLRRPIRVTSGWQLMSYNARPTFSPRSVHNLWRNRRSIPLKHVEHEVLARMVAAVFGVEVVPLLVVDRDPHFWRIAIVQAF